MTNSTNIPAATHSDLSGTYGAGCLTIAFFVYAGIVHRAVRFWRGDMLSTGKVEIYTIQPYASVETHCTEFGYYSVAAGDFHAYADESNPSQRDVMALAAIATASQGAYRSLHADQAMRFAGLEF